MQRGQVHLFTSRRAVTVLTVRIAYNAVGNVKSITAENAYTGD